MPWREGAGCGFVRLGSRGRKVREQTPGCYRGREIVFVRCYIELRLLLLLL